MFRGQGALRPYGDEHKSSATDYALVSLAWSLFSSYHHFPQASPAYTPLLNKNWLSSRYESGVGLGLGYHREQNRPSSCLHGVHSLVGEADE